MTTEVELRRVLAAVLPLLSILLTVIIAQTVYIVGRVERRVEDMSNKVQEHDPRIARLDRSDELDRSGTARVLDLMDRHVSMWQDRYTSMQRELDEFRSELRSIRDSLNRRDD